MKNWQAVLLKSLCSRQWSFGDPSLHRFWQMHACERQTDGWTDGRTDGRMDRIAI